MSVHAPPTNLPGRAGATALAAAAALTALMLAPSHAMAGQRTRAVPEAVSATVRLADLNLASPESMRIARERLAIAAYRLCRTFGDERRVADAMTHHDCTQDALRDALQRLNAIHVLARVDTRQNP